MPALEREILETLLKNAHDRYPIFVESGTFHGETILVIDDLFRKLYTIEIKEEFYNSTKAKYTGNKIDFILGDSTKVLSELCSSLPHNAFFFLDGHYSAGNTGRGDKDCPLLEELSAIVENFPHKAVIICDDRRLFGRGPSKGTEICDWEGISDEAIIKIVGPRLHSCEFLPSRFHPEDRMVLRLKKKA
jgi:hypothetical protein